LAQAVNRTEKLRRAIVAKKLDAFLVTNLNNVRYLTGFSGSSAFVLITRRDSFFFTDFRYKEQSESEVRDFELGLESGNRMAVIRGMLKKHGVKRLGFESGVTYDFYSQLMKLPAGLTAEKSLVEDLRIVKDAHELASIRKAIVRAEEAFLATRPVIRTGVTERAVALKLEEELKKRGCRRVPFDIIVASGKHSSLPHAGVTDKRIGKGDFIIIDWGGEAGGYYSDMTRTLLISGPDLLLKRKIYNTVNTARERAVLAVSAGRDSSEVDAAARRYITDSGYGDFFGHGTGHGVGIEVHEAPRISWTAARKLERGMVFSIEPGIYLPGLGGVRIEDLVLVEARGKILTSLGRRLEVIDR
jgi:Xaa-Pro aminopeptidase